MLTTKHQVKPLVLCILILTACTVTEPVDPTPMLERVYELGANEGVFAYSRISPDGNHLVYASEARSPSGSLRAQTINVVDLRDKTVLFSELGIDGYWSPDGERLIFLSYLDPINRVTIRNQRTGSIVRDVSHDSLGDYYSWGRREGNDVILTIRGRYYSLAGDRGIMPAASIPSCPGIGIGQRPLISKDAQRVTAFLQGTVVVRRLSDCNDILYTHLPGAKADFSWNGRYIAFHAPKAGGGYEIQVVDTERRTFRTIADLTGSSLFPSWTQDGRLLFRYDGDDFRGFMMASNVLAAPEHPLPVASSAIQNATTWGDFFPETPRPQADVILVFVWAPWSAHIPQALADLQRAREDLRLRGVRAEIVAAAEPATDSSAAALVLDRYSIALPRVPLSSNRLTLTWAHNQNPTTLLFRRDELIERRLGAQTYEELMNWIEKSLAR